MWVIESFTERTLRELNREGHSIRAIAQLTGHARNTVPRAAFSFTPKTAPGPANTPPKSAPIAVGIALFTETSALVGIGKRRF